MSIYECLYDWQKKIVDKYLNKKNWGLYLDCGLGKTPVALAFAEQNESQKVLIITINAKAIENENIPGSWFNWSKNSKMKWNLCPKNTKEFSNENELFIINYESLFKRNDSSKNELKDEIVNFVKTCKNKNVSIIVDECHKMKDLSSKQTKCIYKIKNAIKNICNDLHCYLLSGSPFTTGYIDLYSQLKFLGYDEPKSVFKDNFCKLGNIPGLLGWQQPIIGYKNIDLLYKLIHQYAVTIKSEDVLELPEQIFINKFSNESLQFDLLTKEKLEGNIIDKYCKKSGIEIDEKFKTKSKVNNPFYRNLAYPDTKWFAETTGSFWLRARQASIGFQGNAEEYIWYDRSRLNELESFLLNHKDNYLLFYNYTPELLEIYEICEKLGYNIDIYCGEIKSLEFYNRYSKLSEEEKVCNKNNIILANFASGSTGLNWQEYNKCIIFSIPLYKDYSQGIKRLHRNGQKHNVIYYIFQQNNWLDKGMIKALEEGQDYNEKMFKNNFDFFH